MKELSTAINEVKKIDDNLYIITETESVHCYLIIGEEKAIIFDFGYGYESLEPIIREITDLPIIPIASHGDPDHALGCSHFDEVWIHQLDYGKLLWNDTVEMKDMALQYRLKKMPQLKGKIDETKFKNQSIYPNVKPVFLDDSDTVDIGGNVLEVIHTPGHSYGHIMLVDRKNRRLFSGDQVTLHNVWYFGEEDQQAPFSQAVHSLKKILKLESEIDDIYPAHDITPIDFTNVYDQIDCYENEIATSYQNDEVFHSFIGLVGYQHFYKSVNMIYSDERLSEYLGKSIKRSN